MTIREFSLKPFRATESTVNIDVIGKISRYAEHLTLTYEVLGDLSAVFVPEQIIPPSRRDNLWQTTCFECFLRPAAQSQYWEMNFSPSCCWNVYQFSNYRQGGQAASEIQMLPFEVLQTSTALQAVWKFDLSMLQLAETTIEVAIATVIQFQDGTLSYWALTHPGREPDFHHRDSFVLVL